MGSASPQQDQGMAWQIEMPLLTSRFFLYDFAKVILISGGIFYLILLPIFLHSPGEKHIGQMTAVIALIMGGIAFLFVLISLVFFGNHWPMAFAVSTEGVGWRSLSRRGSQANRVAIVVGVLSGKPGMAGAGLLAASNERGWLPWQQVRRVKAYPAQRAISIMNSWRVVVRLYCTPENYGAVLAYVEQHGSLQAEAGSRGELPQTGRPPIAAFEVLRRAGLLACVCMAGWVALQSPPVLVKAEKADLEGAYNRDYAPPDPHPLGIMEMGKALIREMREPMTLDEYIADKTRQHLLANSDEKWSSFLAGLPEDGRWMSLDDPALSAIRDAIVENFARTQWTAMYLPVAGPGRTSYIEFRYETRPRGSKAPASLVYPKRGLAWAWCLGGLLLYALLPWAKNSAWMVNYDRTSIIALDLIGTVVAGFFFALPLYASSSTAEVLGGDFGLTVFLWGFAFIGVLMLIWSARCACFAVMVEQSQLRIGGLFGVGNCAYTEIESAEMLGSAGMWTGVRIKCRSGKVYKIASGPLCRFEKLLEGLRFAGVAVK